MNCFCHFILFNGTLNKFSVQNCFHNERFRLSIKALQVSFLTQTLKIETAKPASVILYSALSMVIVQRYNFLFGHP